MWTSPDSSALALPFSCIVSSCAASATSRSFRHVFPLIAYKFDCCPSLWTHHPQDVLCAKSYMNGLWHEDFQSRLGITPAYMGSNICCMGVPDLVALCWMCEFGVTQSAPCSSPKGFATCRVLPPDVHSLIFHSLLLGTVSPVATVSQTPSRLPAVSCMEAS